MGLGVVLIVLVGLVAQAKSVVETNNAPPPTVSHSISVTGSAELETMPDKAIIYLNVKTEGADAKTAQQQNAVTVKKVMNVLENAGLAKKDIETSGYHLYPKNRYDFQQKKQVDEGYQVNHALKVTVNNIEDVGKIIDLAVDGGTTQISYVQFALSDTKRKQLQQQLFKEAGKQAKEKAALLAEGVGVSVGKVLSIAEAGSFSPEWYYGRTVAMTESAAEGASSQINPQQLKVTAQVQVLSELR